MTYRTFFIAKRIVQLGQVIWRSLRQSKAPDDGWRAGRWHPPSDDGWREVKLDFYESPDHDNVVGLRAHVEKSGRSKHDK